MKRLLRRTVLVLIVILVAIQFFRPARNISTETSATDITHVVTLPQDIHSLLNAACYDCHSNNTHYPWYANIQPVAWYLAHHVNEGKEELNFSEFGSYSKRKQIGKLKAIAGQVREREMPLSSYQLMHPGARLNEQQRNQIIAWASSVMDTLAK